MSIPAPLESPLSVYLAKFSSFARIGPITPNAPITAVYFPLDAVVSVVSTFADGTMREVATIGNEGVVGLPRFLQAGSMPFTAVVQVPGAALRMEAGRFDQAVKTVGSDFAEVLARYTQAWCTQLGQHAVCHGHHRVGQRCARWLLQTQDRVGRATFPLTQEFLAMMLGVRRPSVTAVARQLQQAGLIQYQRGLIHVRDRPGLEAASCECYSVISREMDRLLGPAHTEGLSGEADPRSCERRGHQHTPQGTTAWPRVWQTATSTIREERPPW